MRTHHLAIVSLAAVIGVAVFAVRPPDSRAQEKAPAKSKWDYKVVVQTPLYEKAIADLGEEGWELVTVSVGQQYVKESVTKPDSPFKGASTTTNTIDYGRTVFVLRRPK